MPGTSLTQPQSSLTVPPRLGSATLSRPASASSFAISTMATTCARALGDVLDVAVVVGMAVGQQDVGGIHLVGARRSLGIARSGTGRSSTRASPSVSSKQAWPRNLMSIVRRLRCRDVRVRQAHGRLRADGHADEHAHPRLLGHERLDPLGPRGLVGLGNRSAHCERWASPNQPPSSSACASTRWSWGARTVRARSAPAKRSGSESARTADSTCSSVNTN